MNKTYNTTKLGNRECGSDSSSVDSGKVKKSRSHRPRGCRGGGSRRARKQRREMHFLAQKGRENNDINYLPPSSLNNQTQGYKQLKEASLYQHNHFRSHGNKKTDRTTVLTMEPDQFNMPALQNSSSFSSSGSSETSSALGILPSMPPARPSDPENGARYLEMNPLPPVSMSAAQAMNQDVSLTRQHQMYQQTYYQYKAPSQVEHLSSYQAPQASHHRNKNIHVQKNNYNNEHNNRDHNYTNDRIKKQQQMLSGGGSFFAISPRSFLLGGKKAPTFFF